MTINQSGDILIANILNEEEFTTLQSDFANFDIIISEEEIPSFERYPEKIIFEIDVINFDDYINNFESSKRSSILKRIRDCESSYAIEFQQEINIDDFNTWLLGYKRFISTLTDGRDRIDPNWFSEKASQHIGAFIKDRLSNEIVGGGLIKVFGMKLSLSYAYYEEDLKKKGGSTYLLMELFKYAGKNNFSKISLGRDSNLFGGHLSTGLLDYKLSWHSKPSISDKIKISYIKVNENSKKRFKYYTLNDRNELVLNQNNI